VDGFYRKHGGDTGPIETLINVEAREAADRWEDGGGAGPKPFWDGNTRTLTVPGHPPPEAGPPPPQITHRVAVAPQWDKDRSVVWVDGVARDVKYNVYRLMKALSDARPRGLKKDELESVNTDARGILRHLVGSEDEPWWRGVIVMPGNRNQGGYRLL
jgi:hypothetical protein